MLAAEIKLAVRVRQSARFSWPKLAANPWGSKKSRHAKYWTINANLTEALRAASVR